MLHTTHHHEIIGGKSLLVRRLIHHAGARRTRPVMVFLHEGLGCMDFWFDFPRRLCHATGTDGVLYDRQGYGGSDPMDRNRGIDYLHVEARTVLPALLDRLGIAEAVLVGHSDGGTIALLFAAAHPARVRCLITEAAHVFVDAVTLAGIRAAVDAYAEGKLKTVLEKYHGEKTASVFAAWADTWLSDWFSSWNILGELPGVTAPLLVIQGEDDVYGTLDQVRAIAGGVSGPSETLLVPGCGHAPHQDAPDTVLAAVTRFVVKHLGSAPANGEQETSR